MTAAPEKHSPVPPGVSAATLTGWQASGIACLAAVARLARDGLPAGVPVTSSAVLAPRYGAGTSTVTLATMVLEGHGLLTRARRQYFLARPATRPGSPATGPQATLCRR